MNVHMYTVDPQLSGLQVSDYPNWVKVEYLNGVPYINVWASIIRTFQLSEHMGSKSVGSTVIAHTFFQLFQIMNKWL